MAASIRAEMLNESSREAERIVREAKETAAIELDNVRAQAREMTIELSKQVLDKVLTELFTQREKEKILARNLARLENYDYPKRF
jgi:F0F1-type ATP synthase membrane subunit b/b'